MAWFNNTGGFSPFMQQPQMMQPMQQGGFGGIGDYAEQIRRRQQQQQQQMQQSFGGFRQMGGFGGFSPPMGGFGGFGGGGPMMGGPQRGGWVQELLSGLNQGQGPMQGGLLGGANSGPSSVANLYESWGTQQPYNQQPQQTYNAMQSASPSAPQPTLQAGESPSDWLSW